MTAVNQERTVAVAPRFPVRAALLAPVLAVGFAAVGGLALIAMIGVSVPKAIAAFAAGTIGSPFALAASLNRSSVFALIGFGFAIVQFFERMTNMPGSAEAVFPNAPRYLGLGLIFCGIASLVVPRCAQPV